MAFKKFLGRCLSYHVCGWASHASQASPAGDPNTPQGRGGGTLMTAGARQSGVHSMAHRQTLPNDEEVKWDKLLDNIMKSADAILWGATPASAPLAAVPPLSPKEEPQPVPVTSAAIEPNGLTDLASGQDHLTLVMEGQPPIVDDEFSNVLDDFWLPDYLGGQPGLIGIQSQDDDDDDDMVMPMHDGADQPLLGRANGEMMCGTSSSSDSMEPPTDDTQPIGKSQSYGQPEGARPYIKKPPNAFMLFRKEQSPNVVAQFNITNSAAVNKILGRMWKSLPKKLQARYYQQAEEHKILHSLQYPDWSCTENYGKKRKRNRTRHSTSVPSPHAKESVEDVAPVVEHCCVGSGPGDDALCQHYHKSIVGETHTYAYMRGC
ncbi:uncharacterized protein LOC144031171 isoform X2 [Festucalex cinctus]